MRVLLLEDDPAQAATLDEWLRQAGHEVLVFSRGEALLAALNRGSFDLIILDWEVPDISGLDVLQHIRSQVRWHVPVLFVTQRDAESDIVHALEAGADDYMVKHLSQREFVARVSALGRRLGAEQMEFYAGRYCFRPESGEALLDGQPVELTPRDFALACHLFRHVGRLLSREQLLKDVWGVQGVSTRTVDVHISRIRKSLRISPENGFLIRTVYQHGYRLEAL
jgi:two-component system, OmpR family, response regulator RegX3